MKVLKSLKSQGTDILGISIVVIIFVLILAFVLRGVLLEKPENYQREYVYSKFADDAVDVILRTSTDCRELPVKDLLQICEEDVGIDGAAGEECKNILPAKPLVCPYARDFIADRFNWHLKGVEGLDYYMKVCTNDIKCPEDNVFGWDEGINPITLQPIKRFFKVGAIDTNGDGIPEPCPSSKRSKTYQIPTTSGRGTNIFIILDICTE